MTPIQSSSCKENAYYLPHHGVLRNSTSTRLRVVFNGSNLTSTGASLNESLHVGPKLHQDLCDIILRWRLHAYVFYADITKMYRQILVHPDDRCFQRILWNPSGPPREYQLNTVTYGLSCGPYLALRVLKQLTHDEGSKFPEAAKILQSEMYVDEVLAGADTIELAQIKIQQLDKLLMAGGFPPAPKMGN